MRKSNTAEPNLIFRTLSGTTLVFFISNNLKFLNTFKMVQRHEPYLKLASYLSAAFQFDLTSRAEVD